MHQINIASVLPPKSLKPMASSPITTSLFFLLLLFSSFATHHIKYTLLPSFSRAPISTKAHDCSHGSMGPVNISMTLDSNSLRALVATIFSILSHSSCPNNLRFYLIISSSDHHNQNYQTLLQFIFPGIHLEISYFKQNDLNYARSYLADILPSYVDKVIYLDSNVIVLDDIVNLWNMKFRYNSSVIAGPINCEGDDVCYFDTGVMLVDLGRWREGKYMEKIEGMMKMQKEERIYDPILLVFAGDLEGIDEKWSGIGRGDDDGGCRVMDGEGEVSLVHWSAKEKKPWERFDGGQGCDGDKLWSRYDLHHSDTSYL